MSASPATTLAQEVRAIRPRRRVQLTRVGTFRVHYGQVRATTEDPAQVLKADQREHDFQPDVAMRFGRELIKLARKYERRHEIGAWRPKRLRQLARAYIGVAKAAARA